MKPPPIRRFPDFLSQAQADQWFDHLSQRDWRQYQIQMFGRWVNEPRLIDWAGPVAYVYSGRTLEPRPMSQALMDLTDQVSACAVIEFNHLLMNYYRNGQDSMGWHRDDEPELGPDPTIASLSLGCARDFQLRRPGDPTTTLTLGHGELLLMDPPCQSQWQHQLPKRALSRVATPRINLTFRRVIST